MPLDCPPFLNEDARQAWGEVLAEMDRRGVEILVLDRTALAFYCADHARWNQYARGLAEHDSEKAGEQSCRVPSFVQAQERQRLHQLAQDAWARANDTAALFFLSPADRIRIHNIPSASIPRRRPPGRSAGRSRAQA